MGKSHLKLVAPNTENRTVAMPTRKPNAELRTREYLTDAEVAQLMEAAKGNRWGHRDRTMILIAFRHGRAAPAVAAGGLFRSNPGVAPTPQNRSLGFSRRLAGGAKDFKKPR